MITQPAREKQEMTIRRQLLTEQRELREAEYELLRGGIL